MKPIKLVMSAFGFYAGEATVDFGMDAHGIFLITGDTGAGKTTILMPYAMPFTTEPVAQPERAVTCAASMQVLM